MPERVRHGERRDENDCNVSDWAGVVTLDVRQELRLEPFVFERQRLQKAGWTSVLDPQDAASSTQLPAGIRSERPREDTLLAALIERCHADLAALAARLGAWTLHAFAPNPDAEDSLTRAAVGLGEALRAKLIERTPTLAASYLMPEAAVRPTRHSQTAHDPARIAVLQLCRVREGVWTSVATLSELSDPYPGGVHRMPEDPDAPSRSYLKLEEALDVMGAQPKAGERVVDLGAAPGGWTWAFVKRGCAVTAVDNGPLKLKSLGDWGGEVVHLKEDGLRYRPARPVDWLVADMLIAPAQALGLVRKWHEGGWARRFVVNLKLPQQEPDAVLAPIRTALDALPGFRYRLRQLYHDRREVTLMAESSATPAAKGAPAPHGRGKHATPRSSGKPIPAHARHGHAKRQGRTANPRRKGRQ